jgi:hypothetical protein
VGWGWGEGGAAWGMGSGLEGTIGWEGMGVVSGDGVCLVEEIDCGMSDLCNSFELFDTREGDDVGIMIVLTVDAVDTGFSTTPSSFSLLSSSG